MRTWSALSATLKSAGIVRASLLATGPGQPSLISGFGRRLHPIESRELPTRKREQESKRDRQQGHQPTGHLILPSSSAMRLRATASLYRQISHEFNQASSTRNNTYTSWPRLSRPSTSSRAQSGDVRLKPPMTVSAALAIRAVGRDRDNAHVREENGKLGVLSWPRQTPR